MAADPFKKIFYTLLDISGILLGVFLIALGWWVTSGRPVSSLWGLVVLLLGVSAFLIHLGHYFNLGFVRWIFGKEGYFHKDRA